MGFFDRFKRTKNTDYPAWLDNSTYGTPKWSTQKDEDYLRHAYNRVVWVYSCVSIIAGNVSSVPWELWRVGKGRNTEDRQIFDHPILNLINGRVNPNMSSKDFFDLWATYLATQGKFYATMNNHIIPTQLYPLYGHKVKPIPSRDKFIQGFEYQISSETKIYKDKEVLWSKFNDPLDFYEGMSPIRAMARTIDTENEAVDWNKAQLQNQAVPPGAIQVQNPSPEMQNKLRTEWIKRYSGAKNARVPLVLNAEKANYVPFGLDPVDMDFINSRQLNRVEICSGFGIPSQVVGDPQGQTYANYEEADKAMWKNTLIPKYLEPIKADLNLYIAQKYNENLEIRYCLDDIASLQEDINEVSKRARENFKAGLIKQNEGRREIGFEDDANGDKYVYEIMGSIDTEEEKEPKEDEKSVKKKAINLLEEKQKEMYWKAIEDDREKYEKGTIKQFEKAFDEERKLVVKAVENEKDYEKVIDSLATDKQNILKAMYTLAIADFGEQTYNKIAKTQKAEKKFKLSDFIKNWIAKITGERIVLINDTTKNQVKERIKLAVDEGLSIQQTAKTIDDLYLEQIIPNRSTVIARTEVVSASNFGSLQGATQAQDDFDIELKKAWLSTFDDRVRDIHAAAGNHKPIPLNEKFNVGGEKLSMPGDPAGSAGNVINCRCSIIYED